MKKRVGFIGLGHIGEPMAVRVAQAGFELTVFDIRQEPLEVMSKRGARVAPSAAAVGKTSDIILLVVFDDAQCEEIIVGKNGDGLINTAPPGAIFVIHSTAPPQFCQRMGKIVSERGYRLLDAPLSGMDVGARAGTLTVMVGGELSTLDECRPVFESFAKNIVHVGGLGAGEVAKLVNGLMMGTNMLGIKEGLALAEKAGVDKDKIIEVVSNSTGESWALRNIPLTAQVIKEKTTGVKGQKDAGLKDMTLILEATKYYGVSTQCAELMLNTHKESLRAARKE